MSRSGISSADELLSCCAVVVQPIVHRLRVAHRSAVCCVERFNDAKNNCSISCFREAARVTTVIRANSSNDRPWGCFGSSRPSRISPRNYRISVLHSIGYTWTLTANVAPWMHWETAVPSCPHITLSSSRARLRFDVKINGSVPKI